MFRVSTTPIISTQNCNYSLRYWCSYLPPSWPRAWPRWREVTAQKIWPVPEAVVTVLCTPEDGCGWHAKHVEWTCRIINILLCVASRCTTINTGIHCYWPPKVIALIQKILDRNAAVILWIESALKFLTHEILFCWFISQMGLIWTYPHVQRMYQLS